MCSVLLAVAVFIASAPPSVSAVSSLQAQGVDLFSKALKSEDPVVWHFIGVIYICSIFLVSSVDDYLGYTTKRRNIYAYYL